MANQSVKIAYGYVRQWIAHQRSRIDAARERGDYGKAIRLEAELRRRLKGGKR